MKHERIRKAWHVVLVTGILSITSWMIFSEWAQAQLLPYAEVDLFDIDGRSTLFALTNASDGPVILGISILNSAGVHQLTLRRRVGPGVTYTEQTRGYFAPGLVVCTNTEGDLVAPPGTLSGLISGGVARFFLVFTAFVPTADDCLLAAPPTLIDPGPFVGDQFFVDGAEDSAIGAPLVLGEYTGRWSVRFNSGAGFFDGSFLIFHSATGAPVVVSAVNEAGVPVTLQGVFLSGVEAVLGVSSLIDVAATLDPGSGFGRLIIDCSEPCSVSALWFAGGRFSGSVPGHFLGPP